MSSFLDLLDDLKHSVDDGVVDPRFHYVYQSRLLTVLMASLFVNAALFVMVVLSINAKPEIGVYLSSVSGKVIKAETYKEPILTRDVVAEWSRDAMKTLYNLDHLQYSSQLMLAKQFFSDDAWKLFETQFDAKVKPELLDKKLLITATPAKAVVNSEGYSNGAFSWLVEVPIETTWSGATGSENVRMLAKLTVSKSSTDPRGIVITQFAVDRSLK